MASFNKVILVGNLTRDVELRYVPNGTAVTDIGMAVNDRKKVGDQWQEDTLFIDVTLWAKLAEIASEYLTKGSPVLIEGRLKRETWEVETEQGPQTRSKIRVVADRMQMLGSRGSNGGGEDEEQENEPAATSSANQSGKTDEIPF